MLSKFLSVGANHKKTLVFLGLLLGIYKLAKSTSMQSWLVKWLQQRYLDKVEKGELFTYINQNSEEIVKKFQINVFQTISNIFNTTQLLEDYKLAKNKVEKFQIWQNVKLFTFCQITSILYANVIFVLGSTLHLSILVAYQHAHQDVSFDIMGCHLSYIVTFIERNLKKICIFVQSLLTPLMQKIDLNKIYDFADLENLFYHIQTEMCVNEQMPLRHMDYYFYNDDDPQRVHMLDVTHEAAALLCSEEVISLGTSLVSNSFHLLMKEISSDCDFAELTAGLQLVKIIPKLCTRLNPEFYEKVFVNCMPSNERMQTFSANVFEAFSS